MTPDLLLVIKVQLDSTVTVDKQDYSLDTNATLAMEQLSESWWLEVGTDMVILSLALLSLWLVFY